MSLKEVGNYLDDLEALENTDAWSPRIATVRKAKVAAQAATAAAEQQPPAVPDCIELEPVDGDLLPAIGEEVEIHLNSVGAWVPHRVVGYYVWGGFNDDKPYLHRVFVRVADKDGYLNARNLCDVRRSAMLAAAKGE